MNAPNALIQTARTEISGFKGTLTGPEDAGYDEARKVYNAMIDRRPGLIADCADSDDVAKVVSFARDQELLLAVRGGGHNGGGLGTVRRRRRPRPLGPEGDRGRSRGADGEGRRRLHSGAKSMPRPTSTGWRPRAGSSRPPASAVSPSAAASAT